MLNELCLVIRRLRESPGLATIATLTLALDIGPAELLESRKT
jgi:hypothetical protein